MAQFIYPNIAGSVMQGFAQGNQFADMQRQRQAQNEIAQYAQQAIGGDPAALSRVYAANP